MKEYGHSLDSIASLLRDVARVIETLDRIIYALSDMRAVLKPLEKNKAIFKSLKKLDFFIYVFQSPMDPLGTPTQLQSLSERILAHAQYKQQTHQLVQCMEPTASHPMIQELS